MDAADGMKLDLPVRQSATGIINAPVGSTGGRNAMMPPAAAPAAPVVQPQVSSATSFIPGAGSTNSAGVAAAMANAANPASGLTPRQVDAVAQQPISRFAPGQADQGTRGRVPLAPPASFSAPVDSLPPGKQ